MSELPWVPVRQRGNSKPDPNLTPEDFRLAKRHLWNDKRLLNYLREERGLSLKTIRSAHLGYLQPRHDRPPGIVIPIPPERPVTYRWRYWPDPWVPPGSNKSVKIATPRGHQQKVYPRLPLDDPTIACEGEFDTLLCNQEGLKHGLTAVGVPGCYAKASLLRTIGRRASHVAVILDQGEDEAADRAVHIVRQAGAEAWPVDLDLPEKGDDLTDFFVRYGRSIDELRELIREARHA